MDDGFTLICHGNSRDEQLGPAIVNNTKLPYTSLSNIGDQFVEHLKMKFLPHPLLKQVTLVDSPGMIDSVGEGRGYDFAEAVRWFADRADYVLFFFDGEKPGTTGETLKIFTQSLSGMDHKLLILMNKVDTFKNIGDFVRTYGTLCWNLAKVIPYKDMPQIHTTFVPRRRHLRQVPCQALTRPFLRLCRLLLGFGRRHGVATARVDLVPWCRRRRRGLLTRSPQTPMAGLTRQGFDVAPRLLFLSFAS